MRDIVIIICTFLLVALILGIGAYVVFWLDRSGWWMLAAFLIAVCVDVNADTKME